MKKNHETSDLFKLSACLYGASDKQRSLFSLFDSIEIHEEKFCKENLEVPYLSIFFWDSYFPDHIDLFYVDVRAADRLLSKCTVLVQSLKSLNAEHRSLIAELGAYTIVDMNEGLDSTKDYFAHECYQAELIGGNYSYALEIQQAIQASSDFSIQERLARMPLVERDDGKAMIVVHALVLQGDLDGLKKILLELLECFPKFLWVAAQLVVVYSKLSEYQSLLDLLERQQQYNRMNPQRNYLLAFLYHKMRLFKKSYNLFSLGYQKHSKFKKRFYEGCIKNHISMGLQKKSVEDYILNTVLSRDFVDFLINEIADHVDKLEIELALKLMKLVRCSKDLNPEFVEIVEFDLALLHLCVGEFEVTLKKCSDLQTNELSNVSIYKKMIEFVEKHQKVKSFSKVKGNFWVQKVLATFRFRLLGRDS